ncbi:hypothetical protein [Runella slithyformis]|uniref:Uncharacterized protein n=1 Tax=Runella slithyformis (strain ATCC 29530 / DSM 19594 / LMG 11500 / NCIMB 11436 / LSU 4) TaxID=761193 RepID=A0A7U4E832_RUNSL|nr:hypothetical protein [Runella slithyformis]AEI51273.1 hypothetical protein Runsl_4964 [Runella slithyformis DSM 19594]
MRFFQKNTSLIARLGYVISFVFLLLPAVIAVEFLRATESASGLPLSKDLETKSVSWIF